MIIGQMLEMKITQIAAGFAALNAIKPIGSQARGETGLSRLMIGEAIALAKAKRTNKKPSGMLKSAANPKPMPTSRNEDRMFQPMPWSVGTFWSNGWLNMWHATVYVL